MAYYTSLLLKWNFSADTCLHNGGCSSTTTYRCYYEFDEYFCQRMVRM